MNYLSLQLHKSEDVQEKVIVLKPRIRSLFIEFSSMICWYTVFNLTAAQITNVDYT